MIKEGVLELMLTIWSFWSMNNINQVDLFGNNKLLNSLFMVVNFCQHLIG